MSGSQRFAVLDAGRALAIAGVLLVHVGMFSPDLPMWLHHAALYGQYGVQLFFVISAVTICKTLDDAYRARVSGRERVRDFYVKRVFRIAPLYYVGIIVYGVLDVITRDMHVQVLAPHDGLDVLANALFIHAWVPTAFNSVVPGGWSIGVEMFFYAIAPFLVHLSRTRRGLTVMTIGMAIVCGAFLYAGACAGQARCSMPLDAFTYYWPPVQLPCFIVGFWLYRKGATLLDSNAPRARAARKVALVVAALAAVVVVMSYESRVYAPAPLAAAFLGASLLIMMNGTLERLPRVLERAILAVGQVSYGLYIWHFLALFAWRGLLKVKLDPFAAAHPYLNFAIGYLFVLTVGYGLARLSAAWFEKPASRWARRRFIDTPNKRAEHARAPHPADPQPAEPAPRIDDDVTRRSAMTWFTRLGRAADARRP